MFKNTAGKWAVFAFQDEGGTNPGEPVTGDALNITANIHIDGGAANAVDDTNPTELSAGYYVFDITAVEANGDMLTLIPASSTANVNVIATPGSQATTQVFPNNFADLAITATTGQVTVGTNNDKTGYTASSVTDKAGYSLVATTGLGDQTADITGNLSGSVGSVTGNVGGIAGTIQTLDALDTAQDTQHSTTQTHLTDIKGATWATTDSLEAIRDRGDAAWTTGAGGTPPQLLQNTTIATLASQTSFTLTAGSADNDAYNGAVVVVTDSATSTQKAVGSVSDYVGATKTVTLTSDPGVFTMAVGDTIDIIANASTAPSAVAVADEVATRTLNADLIASQSNTVTFPALAITGELTVSDGIAVSCTTGNKTAVAMTGNLAGRGLAITSGSNAQSAVNISADVNSNARGIEVFGRDNDGAVYLSCAGGPGLKTMGTHGIHALASNTSGGDGIRAEGETTGEGIYALGGTNGHGMQLSGNSLNGVGLLITGNEGIRDLSTSGSDFNNSGNITGTVSSVEAKQDTAQADLDILTGSDGVTLATAQANYAPAKAGDSMDVSSISGDTVAADNLEASLETIVVGTASAGTTSQVTSNVTGHGDDTFIGRVLIFRTGTLQYEAGVITDYTSATGVFDFAASTFTTAATSETFVIV